MKFSVIYADPPWKYNDTGGVSLSKARGDAEATYPTMDNAALLDLPVSCVADDDCMLCLWTTMPKLWLGLDVIKAWGFRYITCGFVWVKLNPSCDPDSPTVAKSDIYSGIGRWVNGNAELCLFGSRGHPFRATKDIKQIVLEPRGAHSVKPARVRTRIERLFGDVPRLEMFAREPHEGWTTIGNAISGNDIRVDLERLAAL